MFEKLSKNQIIIFSLVGILALALFWHMYQKHKTEAMYVLSNKVMNQHTPYPDSPVRNTVDDPNENINYPFIIYLFYSKKCIWAQKFMPEWNNLVKMFNGSRIIKLIAIDINDPANEHIVFYYDITESPTIHLVTPRRNVQYNGVRTADKIHDFVAYFVRKDLTDN